MELLDDLSGFEFEDLMEDVFRNLGYENVRQADRTADEGRDVLMEEVVDGTRRAVVVECKHTETVGRPVVQKLHSAVATYDYDGPVRGIVVTTGRFTNPAHGYAERLRQNNAEYQIDLIDGTDLRDIAADIGLDLYNGRIEILCEETLRPTDPASSLNAPVREVFRDIDNFDPDSLPDPFARVIFEPILVITAETDAVFETSVGVIHRIDDQKQFVVHADRRHPDIADDQVASLITENRHHTVDLNPDQFADDFAEIEINHFGQTETEYKEWAIKQLQDYHTTTVRYTGDNNVTYTKTCEPTHSDISIQAITPVYLPTIRQTTQFDEYTYPYEYYAAGPSRLTLEDGIHRCVHCDTSGRDHTYTYCKNCGSINCDRHIKTERLKGTPVCTGCAVTGRFAFKTKYFYNAENHDAFRREYEQMAIHEKAMENKPLVGSTAIIVILLLLAVLLSFGFV